eukprot:tig00020684_g12888.t1
MSAAPGHGSFYEVTAEDFNTKVLEQSKSTVVVLDCYANWCAPCKKLGPILEAKAEKANGKWILAKLDVDQHGEIAGQLNVRSIPAVFAIKDGKVMDGFVGLLNNEQLDEFLSKITSS